MNLKGFDPWATQWHRRPRVTETKMFVEPTQRDEQGRPLEIELTATEVDDLDAGQISDLTGDWFRMYIGGGWLINQPAMKLTIPGEHRTARLSRQFLNDAATVQVALELPEGFDRDSAVLYWVGFAEQFPTVWNDALAWIAQLGVKERAEREQNEKQKTDEERLVEMQSGNSSEQETPTTTS